jgi:L,D-transpeptidase YnhG
MLNACWRILKLIRLISLMSFCCALSTLAYAAPPPKISAPAPATAIGAEARLLHIYQLIGQGRSREALLLADKLVADIPNFPLAQLVRGDLLLAQAGPLPQFAAIPESLIRLNKSKSQQPTQAASADNTGQKNLILQPATLEELREEAQLRMRSLREQPAVGSLPQAFVQLAAITRNALLVDLSRSRLYHYTQAPNGTLALAASYYITQGRLGAEKHIEGDERTPLGIYYVTENINKRRLDSFYGAGALAINFPNEYDKRRNRSGSGIWLHGVPAGKAGVYARVPKSSNGCLVLSNPDLQRLISTIKPGETPIVITSKATWLAPAEWHAQHASLSQSFDAWATARLLPDSKVLRNFYSASFSSYGAAFEPWFAKDYAAPLSSVPQHATLLYYPGPDEFMVATFYDAAIAPAKGRSKLTRKRQYWHKVNGNWKIFFEGALGL